MRTVQYSVARSARRIDDGKSICWRCQHRMELYDSTSSAQSLSQTSRPQFKKALHAGRGSLSTLPRNYVGQKSQEPIRARSHLNKHGRQKRFRYLHPQPHHVLEGSRLSTRAGLNIRNAPKPPNSLWTRGLHGTGRNVSFSNSKTGNGFLGSALFPFHQTRLFTNNANAVESDHDRTPKDHVRGRQTPDTVQKGLGGIREQLRAWEEAHKGKEAARRASLELFQAANTIGSLPTSGIRKTIDNRITDSYAPDGTLGDPTYASEAQDDDIRSGSSSLEPGDMVEFFSTGMPLLGVYIRQVDDQDQFYAMSGRWLHRSGSKRAYSFIVRKFCDPSELNNLLPFLPQKAIPASLLDSLHTLPLDIPRSAGQAIIQRMRQFSDDSNEVYRSHLERLDRVHEIVADKENVTFKTLHEIAAIILKIPTESPISQPEKWAVHQAIMQGESRFLPDRQFPEGGLFEVISLEEVDVIRQVKQWVREHQEYLVAKNRPNGKTSRRIAKPPSSSEEVQSVIEGFARRAKSLISQSRRLRPLVKGKGDNVMDMAILGPQDEATLGNRTDACSFDVRDSTSQRSQSDIIILRFMQLWSIRELFNPKHSEYSLGMLILKAVGMYEGCTLRPSIGYTFLQEMGVLAPWDVPVRFSTRAMVPDAHWKMVSPSTVNDTDALEQLGMNDKMQQLRGDWGELEVFCIDSASTFDRDDGISIEDVPYEPSLHWVHVHVANPTSFISPESSLAWHAASRVSSQYYPEKSYLMLPHSVTTMFSLKTDRPCLTFSAKVNDDGEILEYKIKSSRIHRVTFITPEMVTAALRTSNAPSAPKYRFALGNFAESNEHCSDETITTEFTEVQQQALGKLWDIARRLRLKRDALRLAARVADIEKPRVTVGGIEVTQPHERDVGIAIGNPNLVWQGCTHELDLEDEVVTAENHKAGKHMVTELMILANHVAGRWCAERNLPVPYRGTAMRSFDLSVEDRASQLLEICANQPHAVRRLAVLNHGRRVGPSATLTSPLAHRILNVSAYVRATSPLRRYSDLLAHWQIESALLAEIAADKELLAMRGNDSRLCFSREDLDRMLTRTLMLEAHIKQKSTTSNHIWMLQAFSRAYYSKQDPSFPSTFQVFITVDPIGPDFGSGVVRELDIPCLLTHTDASHAAGGFVKGDWWLVRPSVVEIWGSSLIMEPLELIERHNLSF